MRINKFNPLVGCCFVLASVLITDTASCSGATNELWNSGHRKRSRFSIVPKEVYGQKIKKGSGRVNPNMWDALTRLEKIGSRRGLKRGLVEHNFSKNGHQFGSLPEASGHITNEDRIVSIEKYAENLREKLRKYFDEYEFIKASDVCDCLLKNTDHTTDKDKRVAAEVYDKAGKYEASSRLYEELVRRKIASPSDMANFLGVFLECDGSIKIDDSYRKSLEDACSFIKKNQHGDSLDLNNVDKVLEFIQKSVEY